MIEKLIKFGSENPVAFMAIAACASIAFNFGPAFGEWVRAQRIC